MRYEEDSETVATEIYEMRTYSVQVGKMADVIELYKTEGYPAIVAGGFDKKLLGYFTGDIGAINQLIHIWKFDDDADRRDHWAAVFADEQFMAFAKQLRPMLINQENKLMLAAPWGPTP
jgi:hypothetical protein